VLLANDDRLLEDAVGHGPDFEADPAFRQAGSE
jgi:hypothetical protein